MTPNDRPKGDPRTAGDAASEAFWRWRIKQYALVGACSAPRCHEPAVKLCYLCGELRCAAHCSPRATSPSPYEEACFLVGCGVHKTREEIDA